MMQSQMSSKVMDLKSSAFAAINYILENGAYAHTTIDKGQYLLRQNQDVECVYWARSINCTISCTSESGKTFSLGDFYMEGRFFGEIELLSERVCQFDVVATEPAELIVFTKSEFFALIEKKPQLGLWIARRVSGLYHDAMGAAIDRTLYPLKFNIIKDILRQSAGSSRTYVYKEAQRFGCTERAYTRVVNELINDGLITRDSRSNQLSAVDDTALQKYMEHYFF